MICMFSHNLIVRKHLRNSMILDFLATSLSFLFSCLDQQHLCRKHISRKEEACGGEIKIIFPSLFLCTWSFNLSALMHSDF